MAGTSVDVALFPLDTIKTRLQSSEGFFKAGGFRGIYNGLSAAAIGSAPGGAYARGSPPPPPWNIRSLAEGVLFVWGEQGYPLPQRLLVAYGDVRPSLFALFVARRVLLFSVAVFMCACVCVCV